MECHRESTSTKVDLLKLMSLECYALSTASRSPVSHHIIQEAIASAKGSIVPAWAVTNSTCIEEEEMA